MKTPFPARLLIIGFLSPGVLTLWGCGTYVSPCYLGTSRCNGNTVQACQMEAWTDSLNCPGRCSANPYECPGGACCVNP
jgi:hypothetical protein